MIINCLKKLYVKIILLIIALFFCSIPANACTLYSAVGDNVANNGTLIAKIRDQTPTEQFYYTTTPDNGYKYWGLYTSADGRGLRAGINEKDELETLEILKNKIQSFVKEKQDIEDAQSSYEYAKKNVKITEFQRNKLKKYISAFDPNSI